MQLFLEKASDPRLSMQLFLVMLARAGQFGDGDGAGLSCGCLSVVGSGPGGIGGAFGDADSGAKDVGRVGLHVGDGLL